jgi:EmrB/QacA subfamily drug resistance transporter
MLKNTQISRFAAFISIISGFFMVMLDSTIVNITLPVMLRFYNTDMSTISWVVNGYNLAFAVILLTGSRLADQFGRKKIFRIGLIAFTITSFLAAIAPNVQMLLLFRVLQGLAGGLLVPVSMPLIIDLFSKSKSGMVIGIWGAVAGVALASGPSLGGIIGEYLTWQWIFYINVPIGIAGIICFSLFVKESFDPSASKKIDWLGMILLSTGMFCLTLALIQSNDKGWGSPYILTLFGIALLCFVLFIIAEKKAAEPMLPLVFFKNYYFSANMISMVILGMAMMCGVFFMAFFLTKVKEFSQIKAGLTITVLPIASVIFSAISGTLSDKVGTRIFAFIGSIGICFTIYWMSALDYNSSMKEILIHLFCNGIFLGLALPPVVAASVKAIPSEKIGIASAVGNVARTLGAILGVALLITMVTHFGEKRMNEARVDAGKMIMENTVFISDVKKTLVSNLENARFDKDSKLPTQEEIAAKFNERRNEVLKKTAPMMQPAVNAVYDKQIKETFKVYDAIKELFLSRIATAFSSTFKWMSLMLLILIITTFFTEPFGRKKISDKEESKEENAAEKAMMHV